MGVECGEKGGDWEEAQLMRGWRETGEAGMHYIENGGGEKFGGYGGRGDVVGLCVSYGGGAGRDGKEVWLG